MAEILIHEGRPVLELTFDEAWNLRNALYWAISRKMENARYWEAEAAESGDKLQLDERTLSRKNEAEKERKLAGEYEQLRGVIVEYMMRASVDRGGVSDV